jgi:methylmalonyl-CoA mutase cobalamin-binding subunit
VAVAATESGWDVLYLGPSLPAEEIAAAVKLKDARAVALSIVYPPDDPRLQDELRRLRRFVGPDVALIVGGRSMPSYSAALQEIGAFCLQDVADLQKELESLAG